MKTVQAHKVSAQEARVQLSDLINKAVYGQQPSVITRQGKPVAVLVAYEEWQAYQRWQQTEQSRSSTNHDESVSLPDEPFVAMDQLTNTEKVADQVAEPDQTNSETTKDKSLLPEEKVPKEKTD